MNLVKRLVFVLLVACGGTTSPGDDASVTQDAASELPTVSGGDGAADSVVFASSCVTDAGTFTCDAGNGWAWGDEGTSCGEPCPVGSSCYTLGAGSSSGVCE